MHLKLLKTRTKKLTGYEDKTFRPYSSITRAEALAMIRRAVKNDDIPILYCHFDDIQGHWAETVIKECYALRLINGVSETQFAPDNNITDEQLIKILVCMLGYSENVPYIGGYPNGYIDIASDIGLLKGVQYCIGNNTSRTMFAQMLYNALSVTNNGALHLIKLPDNGAVIYKQPKDSTVQTENEKQETTKRENTKQEDKAEMHSETDNSLKQQSSTLTVIQNDMNFLSSNDAVIVAEFIDECLRYGWDSTPDNIIDIAHKYNNVAFLEILSDVYNKLPMQSTHRKQNPV